jgi:spermidine synthase
MNLFQYFQEYFAEKVATAYSDPRLTLIFDDASKFLLDHGPGANYDCVIVDSSDPVGPAETLFQKSFFESIKASLNPNGGIVCTQAECIWLHLPLISSLIKSCREIFPIAKYGIIYSIYITVYLPLPPLMPFVHLFP